jgi:hypothetical protein
MAMQELPSTEKVMEALERLRLARKDYEAKCYETNSAKSREENAKIEMDNAWNDWHKIGSQIKGNES